MKTLWILAAAATFAACANRAEDETGAAPDRGDTTVVDTSVTATPSTTGYDTTAAMDTSATMDTSTTPSTGYDTTSTAAPSTGYDTTSTTLPSAGVDTTMTPSTGDMGTDSVRVDSGSETMQGDSALTNTNVPDSSTAP